jgi:glutamate synthase domain-containing protein 3
MARQCHLDTCPTGIATQREDLRAKFSGTPEQVERFVTALAEDVRLELAAIGARSVGEVIGEARRVLLPARTVRVPSKRRRPVTLELRPALAAPRWMTTDRRRADPASSIEIVGQRPPASPVEAGLVARLAAGGGVPEGVLAITTADRSFGAAISGTLARRELDGPVRLRLRGAAGQSFGAFATAGVELRLEGVANDYVGKGLSGGTVIVAPDADLAAAPDRNAIVGNTCLYGATGGRLHVVGRAGMRFGVRNSGASAVVEGVGPHGAEYMTGGTIVVLGPVGPNFGAGLTGGRAFLWDPSGRTPTRLDERSVRATRLSDRGDEGLVAELRALVADHAAAGSLLADHLVDMGGPDPAHVWVVEPLPTTVAVPIEPARAGREATVGSPLPGVASVPHPTVAAAP